MPALLGALGATPDPQAAFINFDRFMSRLPAGVQLFSLFHANPQLLGFVAEIMGGAPRLADQLSTRAGLLDLVIAESFKREPPGREACGVELAAALSQARDFQDTLDIVRRWRAERAFQVGVQLLRGTLGAGRAGEALADIADATLVALKPAVEAEFRRQHGEVAGGEFAIVALGKLGSREMTATSDLDLVLLYDAPEGATSNGEKQLPAPQYFLRLATRFVNAVTAMTPEGSLYEIDTRLRPSGTKGPIATSLAGFRLYNLEDAWTWEHMALTRSRVVAASDGLRARIEATIAEVLRRARDPARTLADVAEMRLRMARERGQAGRWDVKNRRGGIIDVEFAVQALLLLHAAGAPGVLVASTRRALDALDAAGHVARADAQALRRSFELCSAVQAVLRTAIEGAFDPAALPPALLAGLARAAGAPSFDALGASLDEACAAAMSAFERIVAPGAAAG
jgi:glutamate-ammonia-ligase adenylyltransferase